MRGGSRGFCYQAVSFFVFHGEPEVKVRHRGISTRTITATRTMHAKAPSASSDIVAGCFCVLASRANAVDQPRRQIPNRPNKRLSPPEPNLDTAPANYQHHVQHTTGRNLDVGRQAQRRPHQTTRPAVLPQTVPGPLHGTCQHLPGTTTAVIKYIETTIRYEYLHLPDVARVTAPHRSIANIATSIPNTPPSPTPIPAKQQHISDTPSVSANTLWPYRSARAYPLRLPPPSPNFPQFLSHRDIRIVGGVLVLRGPDEAVAQRIPHYQGKR